MDELRQRRVEEISVVSGALAEAASRLFDRPGGDFEDGVLRLGHRPWVAPENYAITIYPGMPAEVIDRYAQRIQGGIPESYASVLRAFSGAFVYGISLAGIPASMAGAATLVDRKILRCHDLSLATTFWAMEYSKVPAGAFHFGGRSFTSRSNVGYFLAGDKIISLRNSGKKIGEWTDFDTFMREEIIESIKLDESLHPSPPSN